jgi:hypothetical protein
LMPRSENARKAIIALIVIQSPYLSAPRYRRVSGTETRPVEMLITRDRPDAREVREARRNRSFERPPSVAVSNG